MPRIPTLVRLAAALAFAATGPGRAAPFSEWSHLQEFEVNGPGVVRFLPSSDTFDRGTPGLRDLRLLDPAGMEIPYTRTLPAPPPPAILAAAKVEMRLASGGWTILAVTGTERPLGALLLQGMGRRPLGVARVEASDDGARWRILDAGVPVVPAGDGSGHLLPLHGSPAAYLRLTLAGELRDPAPPSGATLLPLPTRPAPSGPADLPASLGERREYAGVSEVVVDLGARNLPAASLELEVADPVFARSVEVVARDTPGPGGRPLVLGRSLIHRVDLPGSPPRSSMVVPFSAPPPGREVVIRIHNGDSPPLGIGAARVLLAPAEFVFRAASAGRHTVVLGNPAAKAPAYDVGAFAAELSGSPAETVLPSPARPNPMHRETPATEALAGPVGAPFDRSAWPRARSVRVSAPGVQELELDPAVLGQARPDLADLRLVRDGLQIPYLRETPGLLRRLELSPQPDPDPRRPAVGRWRIELPAEGIPLAHLVLQSPSPLFSRDVRVIQAGRDGGPSETLAALGWSRTPEDDRAAPATVELGQRVRGRVLWIETDNGDNPPIQLGAVAAAYPVERLLFPSPTTAPVELVFGNPDAPAPRYDLALVGESLRNTRRVAADLGPETRAPGMLARAREAAAPWALWAGLAAAVALLLGIIVRLLPRTNLRNP